MAYCQNCGSKVTDGGQFCPACGKPLGVSRSEKPTGGASIVVNVISFSFSMIAIIVMGILFMVGLIDGYISISTGVTTVGVASIFAGAALIMIIALKVGKKKVNTLGWVGLIFSCILLVLSLILIITI